ncbi:MAG TPA: hypothetical protein PLM16_02950 [Candidatus Woesebacteria bacterium]|nr:hypothetical protein [Candidatus Woesebacteria bacterium]
MSSEESTIIPSVDSKKSGVERGHQPSSRLRAMTRGVFIGAVASLAAGQTKDPLLVELGVASWMTMRSILREYIRLNEGNEIPIWAGLVVESGLIAVLIANMPEEILVAAKLAVKSVLEIYLTMGVPREFVDIMGKIVEMNDYYFMMLLYFLRTSNYWLALIRNKIHQLKTAPQEIAE